MEPQFIYFQTYGCTANQNNTEIMKGICLQAGLQLTNNPDIADLLVINTCIVKEPTEKKIERKISDLLNQQKNKPIIIAGCMPQVRRKRLQDKNIYLLGIHHIKDICKLIRKIYEDKYQEQNFLTENYEEKLLTNKISSKKDIGITQISEGCNSNCSFCIVKLAKGKLFSYPPAKIIGNITRDVKSGAKEIWLTSQDNASYGLDSGKRLLPELLNEILKLKGNFKVRLGMMNPENVLPITNELLEIYKNKKMKKFLHIPLQSGSNKILKLMNRNYKVDDFLFIIGKFRKEIPDLVLWTDIIVGFPGETEEDFEKTLNIVKKLNFNFINLSRYWALKGTEGAALKQIPHNITKQRIKKLMNLTKKHNNNKN